MLTFRFNVPYYALLTNLLSHCGDSIEVIYNRFESINTLSESITVKRSEVDAYVL